MDDEKEVVIFEDETVIELLDEEGKGIKFYEIASIEHEDKFYELLAPVEPMEDLGEDDAVILQFTEDEKDGSRNFTPVFDEKLLEELFQKYLAELAEIEGDCGHNCDCCGHDHAHDDCDCDGDCAHDHAHTCDCGCEHDHEEKN